MKTDAIEKIATWIEMWKDGVVPESDVAYVVIRLVAESGEVDLFLHLPEQIQLAAKELVARFIVNGKAEVAAKGGASIIDISSQLQRFVAALKAGGIDLSNS